MPEYINITGSVAGYDGPYVKRSAYIVYAIACATLGTVIGTVVGVLIGYLAGCYL